MRAGTIISGTFGFARRHKAVIASWCLLYMLCSAVLSLFLRPMLEMQLAVITAEAPYVPDGLFGHLVAIYVIFIVMFLMLMGAAFRAVLKPDQGRAAYLRLGMDELRLFGLGIGLFIGAWVAAIGAGLAAALVAVVLALIFGPALVYVLAACLYLVAFGLVVYLAVRFSAAAPLTILYGRISLVESWRLTRGRFWPLFGGYLVIVLIVSVPYMILGSVLASGFYHHFAVAPYDPVTFSAAMREQLALQAPGRFHWFVGVVGGGVLGGIAIALQGAMTAIATRGLLTERGGAD